MDANELVDFIENRMRMSHIYQPLLILTLVDSGGSTSLRHLAEEFLLHDEEQLQRYERKIRDLPVRVLGKHGLVELTGDVVRLLTDPLGAEDRARVRAACERRIRAYLHGNRGDET